MKTVASLACLFGAAIAMPAAEQTRQEQIDEINSTPGVLWKAAVNPRFAAEPVGASASLCGVKKSTKSLAELGITFVPGDAPMADGKHIQPSDLPADFDSETAWPHCAKVIDDIRDQSNCGCCWAFGTAEAASDRMCISTEGKSIVPLSAEHMCFCSSHDGCNGGSPMEAWQWVAKHGLVTGGQQKFSGSGEDPDPFGGGGFCSDFSLPHCHHHGPVGKDPFPAEGAPGCASQKSQKCPTTCDDGAKAPHNTFASDMYTYTGGSESFGYNETRLQTEIMTSGPVTVAFTVYSDFENYAGGIYHHVSGKMAGGHAVKMVGWGVDGGVDYWKVANSWNPYWGEKGYFRIKRGNNECGIAGEAVAAKGTAKWVLPGPDSE